MSGRNMTNEHDIEPDPLLSVVIPAYNEADNVARGVLQKTIDFLAAKQFQSELIVVDDGSSDENGHPNPETSSHRQADRQPPRRQGG